MRETIINEMLRNPNRAFFKIPWSWIEQKKRVGIGQETSFDIFLAIAYMIGISIIANAIAKAQEIFATTSVTPSKLAKIAPVPIIRKML